MFTCPNLIVVKSVTFNMQKDAKNVGKKGGDQMKITTQKLKQLIKEELDRDWETSSFDLNE